MIMHNFAQIMHAFMVIVTGPASNAVCRALYQITRSAHNIEMHSNVHMFTCYRCLADGNLFSDRNV